jgi:UDP:flavonoid glycosyltransferase YjiC (YdhE family)
VFAIHQAFKGKLTPFGFEEVLLVDPEAKDKDDVQWFEFIKSVGHDLESEDPSDVAVAMGSATKKMLADNKKFDHQYKEIVDRLNPDLIVLDNYVCVPSLVHSGRPWVWIFSAAPLRLYNNKKLLPPPRSGFSIFDQDRSHWDEFNNKVDSAFSFAIKDLNDYLTAQGYPRLDSGPFSTLHPHSPFLNIYLYVKELDYTDVVQLPPTFARVENFVRTTNEKFEIPRSLRDKPGKLIFLSMGSFGCAYLKLMTRLTSMLAKSQHRFIVAKGPLADQYELADNMWGQKFVPQMAVLPVVDAVITHGGNNTVTEAFYFGKPMLIMPLFGDQYDNAQRLVDTGLGFRLNPFHCTEERLLSTVDRLVSGERLVNKVKAIGDRIRSTNDKKSIADRVESMFETSKIQFNC